MYTLIIHFDFHNRAVFAFVSYKCKIGLQFVLFKLSILESYKISSENFETSDRRYDMTLLRHARHAFLLATECKRRVNPFRATTSLTDVDRCLSKLEGFRFHFVN